MKRGWILVPLLVGHVSGFFIDYLIQLQLANRPKEESFKEISTDVRLYFLNFTHLLEHTVVNGTDNFVHHIERFINEADANSVAKRRTRSDCMLLVRDLEKLIDYLDEIKVQQMTELLDAFNHIQGYFKSKTTRCDKVIHRKSRCVSLMNSLYKIRFSVYENRLLVYFATVWQYFDALDKFVNKWLPTNDTSRKRSGVLYDSAFSDELSAFIQKIQ